MRWPGLTGAHAPPVGLAQANHQARGQRNSRKLCSYFLPGPLCNLCRLFGFSRQWNRAFSGRELLMVPKHDVLGFAKREKLFLLLYHITPHGIAVFRPQLP